MNDPQCQPPASDPIEWVKADFRHHLEMFYSALKLAPPYHSVEKAINFLFKTVYGMTPSDRQRVVDDAATRWMLYEDAFQQSGLALKHRGIIQGLVRSQHSGHLASEYQAFLKAFST